ncbi:MAG: trans-aconitate 2-methyltransferase [Alphaproteobacteria bacterium]
MRAHWQQVYETKPDSALSWHRASSGMSLDLIRAAPADPTTPVIDVGGGASVLVDDLLAAGYSDVTVLDISEAALGRARLRLAERASQAAWIVGDVCRWAPPRRWAVWHDRAVFHFLTDAVGQDTYLAALAAGTTADATAIFATFAPDGPERCSGLPVQRYDAEALARRLGRGFRLVAERRETHVTPWGAEQRFCYATLRRVTA